MPTILGPRDRLLFRSTLNNLNYVEEHLEAMQRDSHGLEFGPWRLEVEDLWKRIFEGISRMSEHPQKEALETVREVWVSYITHYGVMDAQQF